MSKKKQPSRTHAEVVELVERWMNTPDAEKWILHNTPGFEDYWHELYQVYDDFWRPVWERENWEIERIMRDMEVGRTQAAYILKLENNLTSLSIELNGLKEALSNLVNRR